MRPLLRLLRPFALGVRRDRATGRLYYPVEGVRHYIRFRTETMRERYRRHNFSQIYFNRYQPTGKDCVVDIGAGLGTEIIPLARSAPGLRYIAVEIQPWIYECLCLTLAQLPAGFTPFNLAIGDAEEVGLATTRQGEDASLLEGGPVRVPGITWSEFVRKHGIDQIDLLKMNVEGAEAELLDHIDLRQVRRVIVNVHDFRADRGEGEAFRTRDRVETRLGLSGFEVSRVTDDWIYAERP
jgi:FkbM family methyltransferase